MLASDTFDGIRQNRGLGTSINLTLSKWQWTQKQEITPYRLETDEQSDQDPNREITVFFMQRVSSETLSYQRIFAITEPNANVSNYQWLNTLHQSSVFTLANQTHIHVWRHYEEANMKPVCQLFFRDVEETEMNSRVSSDADERTSSVVGNRISGKVQKATWKISIAVVVVFIYGGLVVAHVFEWFYLFSAQQNRFNDLNKMFFKNC